jgi:CrcB protein
MTALYVALGGALGAVARYGIGNWISDRAAPGFPWGTLVVNVVGSFLIGVAIRWFDALDVGTGARALVIVGIFGGFTTFSTFSYEVVSLIQAGEGTRAALYAGGSLVLGLLAVLAGIGIAGSFLPAR